MNTRLIAPIAGFDENGVYGIGPHLPWGREDGRSAIKLDMGRVVQVTRDTLLAEGKKNILVMGRKTIESMGWRSLPKRRTIVVSQTVDEKEVNANRSPEDRIAVALNTRQAIDRALELEDCGHIFLFGGETVWLEGLTGNLCNAAFITVVKCDSVALSLHKEGDVRKLPHMLLDETFTGMNCETTPMKDMWGETEVNLEFRNYIKP